MRNYHPLTPVELEFMEILWKLGEGTVHDVQRRLPKNRELAYTSVSTILRILQQKKIVDIKKVGRQHIYYPLLAKTTFADQSLNKIVKQAFAGNSAQLVAYLLDQHELSLDDIQAIQFRLDAKKKGLGL